MAAITDMNEEIDVRPVLPTVRVPTLVLHREHEYLREASRYMGERLPGARVVEVPGVDHLPWEGDQKAVLDQIELFLGGLARARRSSPASVLTTVLEADLPASESQLLDSVLSRFRGRVLERRRAGRMRAGFDGPARAVRCATALADNVPALRAGIHTGECELARRHAQRLRARGRHLPAPAPRSPARSSPPRRCRTSSRAPGSSSTSAGRSASCACSACCAERAQRRGSSTSRGCGRVAPKRASTEIADTWARPVAWAISHWPAAGSAREQPAAVG